MEQHLKKRVVGAFLTVVAFAIALPLVLDGARSKVGLRSDIPPMPDAPDWAVVEDEQKVRIELEQLASGEAEEAVRIPDIPVAEQDEQAQPGSKGDQTSLDADNLPYTWTLQLGAFSDEKNAFELRDKLRQKGYKAYTQAFPGDNLTRVYVGPEVQRSEIERLQAKLMKELRQKEIFIRRYRAES